MSVAEDLEHVEQVVRLEASHELENEDHLVGKHQSPKRLNVEFPDVCESVST